MGQSIWEKRVGPRYPIFATVHPRPQVFRDAMGGCFAGSVQGDYDWVLSHGSLPFDTRIMEKYGAGSGASASVIDTS